MTVPIKPALLALVAAVLLLDVAGGPAMAQDDNGAEAVPRPAEVEDGSSTPSDDAASNADEEPEGLRILDADGIDPDDFLWEWRIVAVLADTPNDPAFERQMREINDRADDLFERDVVVITDTDRSSNSPLRQRLRPRGFMLAFIGKDGEIKQRRPAPRTVREINAVIDRFPLRRQEIMERLPSGRD
ncbi:MAG: protein of unknown function containing DUF4174 domain [Rhodobacteraceae bacterium HLUCCA12]|nr:MAG: protein of unknown function containing DUF4174 domain [Rhodobacteraceae bacterium HLUCCA12]